MLNTKYFIVQGANGQPDAQINMAALGNALLVDNIRKGQAANQESDA